MQNAVPVVVVERARLPNGTKENKRTLTEESASEDLTGMKKSGLSASSIIIPFAKLVYDAVRC